MILKSKQIGLQKYRHDIYMIIIYTCDVNLKSKYILAIEKKNWMAATLYKNSKKVGYDFEIKN